MTTSARVNSASSGDQTAAVSGLPCTNTAITAETITAPLTTRTPGVRTDAWRKSENRGLAHQPRTSTTAEGITRTHLRVAALTASVAGAAPSTIGAMKMILVIAGLLAAVVLTVVAVTYDPKEQMPVVTTMPGASS